MSLGEFSLDQQASGRLHRTALASFLSISPRNVSKSQTLPLAFGERDRHLRLVCLILCSIHCFYKSRLYAGPNDPPHKEVVLVVLRSQLNQCLSVFLTFSHEYAVCSGHIYSPLFLSIKDRRDFHVSLFLSPPSFLSYKENTDFDS